MRLSALLAAAVVGAASFSAWRVAHHPKIYSPDELSKLDFPPNLGHVRLGTIGVAKDLHQEAIVVDANGVSHNDQLVRKFRIESNGGHVDAWSLLGTHPNEERPGYHEVVPCRVGEVGDALLLRPI